MRVIYLLWIVLFTVALYPTLISYSSLRKSNVANFNSLYPWISDNGDSTYKNPVIFADYSDPDVIRVGEDFYLISSSFANTPGLPVLHSKDLINWRIIGHVVNNLPFEFFNKPQHGSGIWAPSLRFHEGKYWVFYGDPDFGLFMSNAQNPSGPWKDPVCIKEAKGRIDPCPFWDDDGKAYLIHAWAKSRVGFNSILTLTKLSPDGSKILDEGEVIFDGQGEHPTIEGPKLYKRNGYYYIFAPAGGVTNGWQTVLRSKNIYGPYEAKVVLEQGRTNINGPHQGALVDLNSGESWFIHFQDRNVYGRIVHLQPVQWLNDWPLPGLDIDGNGIGEPVMQFRKPSVGKKNPISIPQTSDEFASPDLGFQWQWEGNHEKQWISLNDKNGFLRFMAVQTPSEFLNLWDVPSLLMQKFPAPAFIVTTSFNFYPESEGEKSGLLVMGRDYSYLSITKADSRYLVSHVICLNADKGETEHITKEVPVSSSSLFFRVDVSQDALCHFSYSFDGRNFTMMDQPFQARKGKWIGAKVGIFSIKIKNGNLAGYTDFDWFRFN